MLRKFLLCSILIGVGSTSFVGCDSGSTSPTPTPPADTTGQGQDTTGQGQDTTGQGHPPKDTVVHAPPDSTLPGSKSILIDTASFGMPATDSVPLAGATWFRVETQADSVYSITGVGLPGIKGVGKADIKITVLSQSVDQILATADDVGTSRDPFVVVRAPANGYLRVKVEVGKSGSSGFFNLTVRRMDRWEPNDTRATAGHLAVDSLPVRAIMEPSGSDWFAFPTKPGGFYRVATTTRNTWVTHRGIGDDSVPLVSIRDDSTYGIVFQAKEATSYVEVNQSEAQSTSEIYALYCQKLPNDTLEDDGSFAAAHLITVDNAPQSHQITEFDLDVIKIPIRAGYVYRNQITSSVRLDAYMFQDTTKSGWAISVSPTSGTPGYVGHTVSTTNGFMYLAVSAQARGTYKVQENEYPGDSFEPDDMSTAVALQTGAAPVARFMMINEADWFSFQAEKGKEYWLNTTDPEKVGLKIAASTSASAAVTLNAADGSFRCTASGTYYFKLTATYAGPYTVALGSRSTEYFPLDGTLKTREQSKTVEWLDVHLDNTHDYRFDLTALTGSVTIALCGMDSMALKPGLSLVSSGALATGVIHTATSSDFRIKVTKAAGTDLASYTLSAKIELSDSLEPDDSIQYAHRIPTDSTFQNHVLTYGDVDWVCFKTEIGQIYEPLFTSSSSLSLSYGVYDSKGLSMSSGSNNGFVALDTVAYLRMSLYSSASTTARMPYAIGAVKFANDSLEPDNSFAKASTISVDSQVQFHKLGAVDKDFVKFPVVKGRIYTLTFRSSFTGYAYVYALDTLSGNSIYLYSSSPTSSNFSAPATGYMYLKITTSESRGTVYVAVKESGYDRFEPDDGLATSVALKVGDTAISRYLAPSDADWFKIAADSGKIYTLKLSPSDVTSPRATVFASDSTIVPTLQTNVTGNDLGFACIKSGTYFVKLGSSDTGAYRVAMAVADTASWFDVFEPDNKLHAASAIKADSVYAQHLISSSDEDWIRLDVDSGAAYIVKLKNTGTEYAYYSLFNADSTLLKTSTTLYFKGSLYGDSGMIVYKAPKTTSIYVRVTGSYSYSTSYRILSYRMPSDTFEIDSSIATAKPIATDSTIQSHLISAGDIDWVGFAADSGVSYSVQAISRSTNTVGVSVYGEDGIPLVTSTAGTKSSALVKAPSTAKLYVRVTTSSTGTEIPFAYDLLVSKRTP